jgi:hypothetical protein
MRGADVAGSSVQTPRGGRLDHLAERPAELGDLLFKLGHPPSQLIPDRRLGELGSHAIRMPSRPVCSPDGTAWLRRPRTAGGVPTTVQ